MKIRKLKNDIIQIDFNDTEKALLDYVDEALLFSWAETIGRSLDETIRIMSLTCSAQMAAQKRIKAREIEEANRIVDPFVDDVFNQVNV